MRDLREAQDHHFPLFFNDNAFRRLLLPPRRLVAPFVREGDVVADLGCGPGFHTLALARAVGPRGKVYAVDPDESAIRAVQRKAGQLGLRNVDARVTSASDLRFVADGSVDFALAHGLLCSMAPREHAAAVRELQRILKPTGRAYVSVARGPWSYVGSAEWEAILAGFTVVRRGEGLPAIAHRWAIVAPRDRAA
jgi:ubiquinone/menaquinone biosynthesis C-methylase UbiE